MPGLRLRGVVEFLEYVFVGDGILIGIAAGFLNVYRDTKALLKKIARQDALRKGLAPQSEGTGVLSGEQGKTDGRERQKEHGDAHQ